MEKYSLEKAQEEAQKMRGKINSGDAESYNEAEKLIEKKEKESEVLEDIKQKILNKEICAHAPTSLLYGLKKDGIDAESQGVKNLAILKKIFTLGIYSSDKIRRRRRSNDDMYYAGNYDKYTQVESGKAARKIIRGTQKYVDEKRAEGANKKDINYNEMVNDREFIKSILSRL